MSVSFLKPHDLLINDQTDTKFKNETVVICKHSSS